MKNPGVNGSSASYNNNNSSFRKEGIKTLNRPTYYLWKHDFPSEQDYETAKNMYAGLGFRVVTCTGGADQKDIHPGLKAVIQNHTEGPCA